MCVYTNYNDISKVELYSSASRPNMVQFVRKLTWKTSGEKTSEHDKANDRGIPCHRSSDKFANFLHGCQLFYFPELEVARAQKARCGVLGANLAAWVARYFWQVVKNWSVPDVW